MHITPPSTTSLINALVKDNLVKRIIDKKDRRTVKLQTTNLGTELLKNSFKRITAIIEKGIHSLNEREKNNFIVILNKLAK